MFGLNDVYQSVSEQDYGESLGAIVSRLKYLGSEVVVLGPTPFPAREQAVRSFSLRASREASRTGADFVDCLAPFYQGQPGSRGAALAGRNSPDRSGPPGPGGMDLEATSGDGEIIPGRSARGFQ